MYVREFSNAWQPWGSIVQPFASPELLKVHSWTKAKRLGELQSNLEDELENGCHKGYRPVYSLAVVGRT